MRPVVAFGVTGAGEDVGADADADVSLGASDNDRENDGTIFSGIAPPEGETPPRGGSLSRSPRSAGMSMLESKEAR